ncbi:hypothetical protein [Actinomadura yumaensis]|uniref:DNA-binding protein n=1 Tax=Actinomadura yumaensis TaxID=111807 RepID=A0ABW2CNR4_9ACTN
MATIRIQPTNLVGVTEIAVRCGVTAAAVSNWGERHDFPAPIVTLAAGPIWSWTDVMAFLILNKLPSDWAVPTRSPEVLAEVTEKALTLPHTAWSELGRSYGVGAGLVRILVAAARSGEPFGGWVEHLRA